MTILVTGGAGYIGSHMVYALVDAGERMVVLDNLSTGFDWAIAKGVPLVVGDTGDQALVSPLIARPRASTRSFISPARSWCRIRSPIRSAITATTPSNSRA